MTKTALVVGSGAIGLRTALELLKRNVRVILHSAQKPTHTSVASVGAGGLWMPFKCNDPRVEKWGIQTLDELVDIQNRERNNAEEGDGKNILVEQVPVIYLRRQNDVKEKTLPPWTKEKRLKFDHMNIEMLEWQNSILNLRFPFPSSAELVKRGYHYCWFFQAPIVDSPKMLEHMSSEVTNHPLNVDTTLELSKPYSSLEEMVQTAAELNCDTLVNCTGLASRTLCQDQDLYAGRGVLLQYDRSCARHPHLEETSPDGAAKKDVCVMIDDPPLGTDNEPTYMIPRGNIIAIGGSYYEHDTEPTMRPHERTRLIENAQLLGIDTSRAQPINEWVGFRPCRPTARVEVDRTYDTSDGNAQSKPVKVIHNYGHGGSGWTIFAGAAKTAADLALHS